MVITYTVNKKNLENIINKTFSKFGYITSSFLLDSLKLLGFHYATNSGLSISIEDFKTPKIKDYLIADANTNINLISKNWKEGFISKNERLQNITYNWTNVTETLKLKIVEYYKKFNPTNNLYMMAFSGARGNISQVNQLIGVRGLMADQNGKTIDIPININFREGLSSTDYIVSSYGARKGIVDTALKTATSGYLTRRLIYATKNSVIRELDCKTTNGLIVFVNQRTNYNNILGSFLNWMIVKNSKSTIILKNIFVDEHVINYIKNYENVILNLRSIITCNSNNLVCQKCYGWDISKKKIISLGDTVGVLAAQSISEPGTQLTMRTFHTGGVFTANSLNRRITKTANKIVFPTLLNVTNFRIDDGSILHKLSEDITLKLIDWKGKSKEISLNKENLLYLNNTVFVGKNKFISENILKSTVLKYTSLKHINSAVNGQVSFDNNFIKSFKYNNKTFKTNIRDLNLNIKLGDLFRAKNNINYKIFKGLNSKNSLGYLKINSILKGHVKFKNNILTLFNSSKKIVINFNTLNNLENYKINFQCFIKNYQIIDKNTTLGLINFVPKVNNRIYSVKTQKDLFNYKKRSLLLISDAHISKITIDQVNNKSNYINNYIHFNYINKYYLLKEDGFRSLFQLFNSIFLRKGTIINFNNKDLIFKNNLVSQVLSNSEESKDIVQGLPKIDELIEARVPEFKAFLNPKSGILFKSDNLNNLYYETYENNIEFLKYKNKFSKLNKYLISILNTNFKYDKFSHKIDINKSLLKSFGHFCTISSNLTEGNENPHELLKLLFKYHIKFDGLHFGSIKSLNKFQLIFINSIQKIYEYQGVNINHKHIEIIIKSITSRSLIIDKGNSPFLPNEYVKNSFLNEIYKIYNLNAKLYEMPIYEPKLISIKNYSLSSESFISNISFQQTKKILIKSAIEGSKDWLKGLKESVILGRSIPGGTTFLNYKNYLDNVFLFKN